MKPNVIFYGENKNNLFVCFLKDGSVALNNAGDQIFTTEDGYFTELLGSLCGLEK